MKTLTICQRNANIEQVTKVSSMTDTPHPDDLPKTPIVSSAHLADSAAGWQLSELEYAMTMTYNAFSRWMMHCMKAAGPQDFNPLDILVLHNINHRDKSKRLSDIAFMLNFEDTHTVNYAVKKLVKADLVIGRRQGKEMFYQTTPHGQSICESYGRIRQTCLLEAADGLERDLEDLSRVAKTLRNMSGVYDQASRAAATL